MFSSASSVRQQLSECRNEIIQRKLGNRIKKFMLNIELGRVGGVGHRAKVQQVENSREICLNRNNRRRDILYYPEGISVRLIGLQTLVSAKFEKVST